MADVESAANSPSVHLTALRVDQQLLSLNYGTRLALVVNSQNFASDFELAPFAGNWQWLEELKLAFTIEHMLGIEFWNALNGCGITTRVKVDDLLVGVLEGEDDRICREGGKFGMKFLAATSVHVMAHAVACSVLMMTKKTHVEKVQFIRISRANACREKQQITLQPCNLE